MKRLVVLVFVFASGPLSGQTPDSARHVNLFATAWLGGTTEPLEDRWPASPQVGLRVELIPGRISIGVEGTLDFIQADSDELGQVDLEVVTGLTGLLRADLGKGERRPYLVGFWGNLRSQDEDYHGYGGGAGLFLSRFLWGRSLQLEIRYRDDNRPSRRNSGRWEVGLGLGILR
jgi:hypothetical protein